MICSVSQESKIVFFLTFFFAAFLSSQESDLFFDHKSELIFRLEVEKSQEERDDEKLAAEIYAVSAMFYKNLIDISALYFSGILLDSNQLYERAMFDLGKHLFDVIKSFAWYGPKMIQNPKLSWKIKAKKTMYMVSFLMVCWIWYQEVASNKKHKSIHGGAMPEIGHFRPIDRGYEIEDLPQVRPRVTSWT